MFKFFAQRVCFFGDSFFVKKLNSSTLPLWELNLFYRHASSSPNKRYPTINKAPNSENADIPLSFQEMLRFREKQAASSVLIELPSKEDIPKFTSLCKDFGVRKFIPYSGEFGDEYLLTEFANESVARKFLRMCQFKSNSDNFPVSSRLVRYEGRKQWKQMSSQPSGAIAESNDKNEENASTHSCQVSTLIENHYNKSKLSDLSIRKRFLFGCLIYDAMSGMFPHSAVLPFGSSVNGFGSEGCDLDVVFRLFPEKSTGFSELFFQTRAFVGDSRVLQQRAILCIYEVLRAFFPGVNYVQKILNARVPILKFKHKILDLDCDISVNNVTAVNMSEILHFYASLDPRVQPLVFAVRKWAKEANITYESPGSWITNFSLTLLVIYFLQNRPLPVLPPLKKAVSLIGLFANVQYTEKPSVWRQAAKKNSESLAVLLLEFFIFLAKFPFKSKCVCILSGQANARDDGYPLWIRYPLEEDMNVSKNVSLAELDRLCDLANLSAKHLETFLTKPLQKEMDLSIALGIPLLKNHLSEKLDVSELYSKDVKMS